MSVGIQGQGNKGDPGISFIDAPFVSVPNTTINNRAQIRDLSQDFAPRAGVSRVQVASLCEVLNEYGPNGERVWTHANDQLNHVRMVGNWPLTIDTNGVRPATVTTNDYIEIVFYGTGLNLLGNLVSSEDVRATIDGGVEGSNLCQSTYSSAPGSRGYNNNQVLKVCSGLTFGLHTVKIRNNSSNGMNFAGYEVLKESDGIFVQAGSYVDSQNRKFHSASETLAFKPALYSGTRGARVIAYTTGSGPVQQAFTNVDSSSKFLSNADHTNEEVYRTFWWREFGCNRSDDFQSFEGSGPLSVSYVLEDGVNAMSGSGVGLSTPSGQPEGLQLNTTSNYYYITFVGTGLDLVRFDYSTTIDPHDVTIDNTSVGNITSLGIANVSRVQKICSGLPFGTHTVRITRNSAAQTTFGMSRFMVYQPKRPTIPTNAVEIADYCVMANGVIESVSPDKPSVGVIRHYSQREVTYVGSGWSVSTDVTFFKGGLNFTTSTAGNFAEFTFFGTGVEWCFKTNTTAMNTTVSIDGSSALNAFTTTYLPASTGTTFTASTGTLSGTSAGQGTSRLSITGLTLGFHTIRVTQNTTTTNVNVDSFDVFCPVYAPSKMNSQLSVNGCLNVGNSSIVDSRQRLIDAKNTKFRGIAYGVASSPGNQPSTILPVQDMVMPVFSKGAWFDVRFNLSIQTAASLDVYSQLMVDGIPIGNQVQTNVPSAGSPRTQTTITLPVYLTPGIHLIQGGWLTGSNALTANSQSRTLSVEEQ